MKQNWYFIFSEGSVFRKRYIKFFGTREQCARNQNFWHLDGFVAAVLSERDFDKDAYDSEGYKELDIDFE